LSNLDTGWSKRTVWVGNTIIFVIRLFAKLQPDTSFDRYLTWNQQRQNCRLCMYKNQRYKETIWTVNCQCEVVNNRKLLQLYHWKVKISTANSNSPFWSYCAFNMLNFYLKNYNFDKTKKKIFITYLRMSVCNTYFNLTNHAKLEVKAQLSLRIK
jgi:hypothetical protein